MYFTKQNDQQDFTVGVNVPPHTPRKLSKGFM